MRKTIRIFRQHYAADPDLYIPSRFHRQLIGEWADLHSLPSTSLQVKRWGRIEPVLAGYRWPGEIVDAIDAASGDTEDALLLALIRLFQSGQQLAGRTLVQSLLPKLCQISSSATTLCTSARTTWLEDRRHITVAEFWGFVASYPVHRRTSRVASNLALDTLHRISGVRTPADPEPGGSSIDGLREDHQQLDSTIDGLTDDADLLQVVHWGVTNAVITRADARLLILSYLPNKTSGFGFDDAAEAFGLTQAAVRQRCSRATRRLADAVRHEIHTPIDQPTNNAEQLKPQERRPIRRRLQELAA